MWSTYFHTLRHLRARQILGRVTHRLHRPKADLRPAPDRRPLTSPWHPPCGRPTSFTALDSARFLNIERRLTFPDGWNDPAVDKLWLYNLHYFEGLLSPDGEMQSSLRSDWVQRWMQDNPPGQGNGWEPYPLSLRITNWIKWVLNGASASPEMLHSLAVQTRYLRQRLEHHLLGNHLFENAKALVAAGLFFSGQEADGWYATGRRILQAQLKEQLLEDGGHFERSPMYQALLLEGLLDLHNLHHATGAAGPSPWSVPAARMLDWLHRLCHPDGEIAFFNDAAFGIAPPLHALDAYARRLGISISPVHGADWLGASGYARLERANMVLLADVAPVGPDYLPGHAHADSLSFECSIRGRRVLVNGGTSTYAVGAERQRQRSTAAHNTVCVNGENSSEVWAGFRVARRARTHLVRFTSGSESTLDAWHDGYCRLRGRPVHRRRWTLGREELEIADEVLGNGDFRVNVHFHFHPDMTLLATKPGAFRIVDRRGMAIGTIEVDGSMGWQIAAETWHPGFGMAVPTIGLTGQADIHGRHQWRTRIRWSD